MVISETWAWRDAGGSKQGVSRTIGTVLRCRAVCGIGTQRSRSGRESREIYRGMGAP